MYPFGIDGLKGVFFFIEDPQSHTSDLGGPENVDACAGPADAGGVEPDLRGEGLGQEELDHGHEANHPDEAINASNSSMSHQVTYMHTELGTCAVAHYKNEVFKSGAKFSYFGCASCQFLSARAQLCDQENSGSSL